MATTYGNNKRKQIASITDPRTMTNVSEQGGRMRVMYDTYEADGNTATNNSGANGTVVVIG